MDLPPRSALFGLTLQLVGGVLVLFSFLATFGRHKARLVGDGRCHYIGPDVMAAILRECHPGENRSLAVGLIIGGIGLVSIVVGRRLAKRSGLH